MPLSTKVRIALDLGTHAIKDLSNSGATRLYRKRLVDTSLAMVGTVPMYDAVGHFGKPLPDIL